MGIMEDITPWKAMIENTVGKAIDLIPNKNRKNEMKAMLDELKENNTFQTVMAEEETEREFMRLASTQIQSVNEISLENAKSKFWLAANWRPLSCLSLCMTACFCILYGFVVGPWFAWVQAVWFPDTPPVPQIPPIDFKDVMWLVGGVLGLFGASRFGEKLKGVASR